MSEAGSGKGVDRRSPWLRRILLVGVIGLVALGLWWATPGEEAPAPETPASPLASAPPAAPPGPRPATPAPPPSALPQPTEAEEPASLEALDAVLRHANDWTTVRCPIPPTLRDAIDPDAFPWATLHGGILTFATSSTTGSRVLEPVDPPEPYDPELSEEVAEWLGREIDTDDPEQVERKREAREVFQDLVARKQAWWEEHGDLLAPRGLLAWAPTPDGRVDCRAIEGDRRVEVHVDLVDADGAQIPGASAFGPYGSRTFPEGRTSLTAWEGQPLWIQSRGPDDAWTTDRRTLDAPRDGLTVRVELDRLDRKGRREARRAARAVESGPLEAHYAMVADEIEDDRAALLRALDDPDLSDEARGVVQRWVREAEDEAESFYDHADEEARE